MDSFCTQSDFLRLAVTAFPDLAEEFEHIGEYWTLQITAFGRRMQQAKGAADWDGYERGVSVITELWPRADEHLSKALSFTLMKALDFEGAWTARVGSAALRAPARLASNARISRPTHRTAKEGEETSALSPPTSRSRRARQLLSDRRITSCCNMSGAMSKVAIAVDRLEVQLRRRAPRAF